MQVSVYGLGYVGTVTAAALADAGHDVVGVDTNPDKVAMINRGQATVIEPELPELLGRVQQSGRLRATTETPEAVQASDVAMICVGTPSRPNGSIDTEALQRVGEQIGAALHGRTRPFHIVLRSTVLPGTVEAVLRPAVEAQAPSAPSDLVRFGVNPEFMREGSSLQDFHRPAVTLVGASGNEIPSLLRHLYTGVAAPFVVTDINSAEMVKYASNAFHALKIAFTNEVSNICEASGADPNEVMRVFRMDKRLNISEAYLNPGFAFGGSCLPKDLRALVHATQRLDLDAPVLRSILPSNTQMVERGINQVRANGKRKVGVVGLAFKPQTDDLREGPLVSVVEALLGKGYDVRVLDSNVSLSRILGANREYIETQLPHIAELMCENADELLAHGDVIVLGNRGEDAERVMRNLDDRHTVVDLTRSFITGGVREARRTAG